MILALHFAHMAFVLIALFAYLLGAIPSSVWYGKLFHKKDVRQEGSGNPGATNTFRVLGKKAGFIVLFADVAKGALAANLAWLLDTPASAEELFEAKFLLGMLAVAGHVFSVFLGFRGGKGVAALLGVIVALHWQAALFSVLVFFLVVLLSHYVSLGSILGTLSYPLALSFVPFIQPKHPFQAWAGWLLVIFITFTHRKNIRKILKGAENKTYIFKSRVNNRPHDRNE